MLAKVAPPCKPFVSVSPNRVDYETPWAYAQGYQQVELNDLKSLARLITSAVWSGCVWQGGERKEKCFHVSSLCVLDVDNGYPLQQAIKDVCDSQHVIATTKSHGIKGDRYRIILPWEAPIPHLDVYRYNMERVISRFDADPACVDAARYFWPSKEVVSISEDGYFEDVRPLPPDYETKNQKELQAAAKHLANPGVLPAWITSALKNGVPEGFRNNNVYDIAKVLAYHGLGEPETIQMIMNSAIKLTLKEVSSAVKSGRKRATEVQARLGKEGEEEEET
jgi:hypothetical protein